MQTALKDAKREEKKKGEWNKKRVLKADEGEKEQPSVNKTKPKASVPLITLITLPSSLYPLNSSGFSGSSCVGVLASCRSLFCVEVISLFVQLIICFLYYGREVSKFSSFEE